MTRKLSILPRPFAVLALACALALALAPAVAAQDTGSADFTRFVALGDSLSAGFTDGGLVQGPQVNSMPNLIYGQATGGSLEQPLVSAPGIPALLRLQGLFPTVVVPRPGQGAPLNLTYPAPYDNLSVPGYTLVDATTDRSREPTDIDALILRVPNTMLEQALALQPTFAYVWLGNNDVLGAAVSGRAIDGVTLTPVAVFDAEYRRVVSSLAAAGADLVVATIPDVTSIPFVSTLPPVLIDPTTNEPVIGPGGTPIPILGPSGAPLGPNDKVLLPASAALAQGIGVPVAAGGTGLGLPDELVLSASEVATIRARTDAFNAIIRDAAAGVGAPVLEAGAFLDRAASEGIAVGGIEFTSAYITGGIFSLDGIHPLPFGYAYLANEFIEAINQGYGASIPAVDLSPFIFGTAGQPIPGGSGAAAGAVTWSPQLGDAMRDLFVPKAAPAGPGDDGEADDEPPSAPIRSVGIRDSRSSG